jgi:hypothetical protein
MNKAKLKSYAPQARKDFIAAVTARANLLGLSEKAGKLEVATSQPQGDATVIAGQAWPIKVHSQRQQLIARIQNDGFAQTMEAVAYTWFNRFAALRYMELHDYLGHGHRALSSLEGALPDILTHAADLAQNGAGNAGLPGLKPALVVEMKLAGNRDGELYSMLLVAQCNALSNVMPFLFERIDDETELLLPDNLLRTDSVIAKLVTSIEEEDWKEVEIIGWLYQFYISEKKDEVIGKVVKSEDIPAATQLFTPNWIVQYLVQNSVGRLWLMANPASTLKAQWPYYIEPASQTLEAQVELDALIQTRMHADGDSLNPESITLLDPACGSGHILVEAYEVLKAIYLERGYQPRAIPRLILEKNLFGLDIDDRAAQMAGFALLMKARFDDRRLFNEPVKLNVFSLQESKGLDVDVLTSALQTVAGGVSPQIADSEVRSGFAQDDLFPGSCPQLGTAESRAANKAGNPANYQVRSVIAALISTFAFAKTFGALIQITPVLSAQLETMADTLQAALQNGDLYAKAAAQDLLPLVAQARLLGMQFDAVVANPPYMGGKGMNPALKDFAKATFPDSKSDLFAMFMERGFNLCKPAGFNSMVTMQSWMFLSSYESMREKLLGERTLSCMVHMGNGVMGIAFGTAATVMLNQHVNDYMGCFSYCGNSDVNEVGVPTQFPVQNERLQTVKPDNLKNISGCPIAYWVSDKELKGYGGGTLLGQRAPTKLGMTNNDNNRFLRSWSEVCISDFGTGFVNAQDAADSKKKWFPYNKGGSFRKWYGNNFLVVNWEGDGREIKELSVQKYGSVSKQIRNISYYFRPGITWSFISSQNFGARSFGAGFLFDVMGSAAFPLENDKAYILGLLGSVVASRFLDIINPTVSIQAGDIARIPLPKTSLGRERVEEIAIQCENIARQDWDSFEVSWDFSGRVCIGPEYSTTYLSDAWETWNIIASKRILEMQALEEENNRIFISAFDLQGDLSPEVPESQITLARADRERDSQRLMSYAIGCMMGRYSLDEPGLIYANAGNVGFDASRYASFPADADGIVPLTDEFWFEDEAAGRIREFLLAAWGGATLSENMFWLAESLGIKAGDTPDETIRSYLADKFYKDHLQTYKKRPIYWLFSSGKQGAFQALVYLHRYHEGTLSRMRAEYVVPLTGKIQSRIEMVEKDAAAASSTAARNKLAKEVEKLKKKHVELLAYDEQLRHYADMRITLDLDDGVKVNYGKFGNLLAEVKAVTGGASDD